MMFGRSREDATPVLAPLNAGSGRTTAISILPGVPLPPELMQLVPEPAFVPGADAVDERELVTAGAPAREADAVASSGSVAPASAPVEPARRSSFFGLRRRDKVESEDPSFFFGDDDGAAPEP